MIKRILSILVLSLACINAVAQNEGTLRLYMSPPAEAVTIDGTLVEFGNSIKLRPGKYFLQAWCPNKTLLDTIVEIKPNEVLNFFYRFENSPNYSQYIEETVAYQKEKNRHLTLPIATAVISGGALAFTYFRGKTLQEEAEAKYLEYKYAGVNIAAKEKEFKDAQKKYRSYYYAQYAEYAALALSSYFIYKGIKWLKDNPKPELEKDKNPFTLDQVGFMPNQYGGYGLGITIDIN